MKAKFPRSGGVLMPIAALDSPYGIGTFSKEAFDFVDFLSRAGQSYWQILPLGPTGMGDSPYQTFSTFAGSLYYIDVLPLRDAGWITDEEIAALRNHSHVDYGELYKTRVILLRKAYKRSNIANDRQFIEFCKKNADWLEDYSVFSAAKDMHEGDSWQEWEKDLAGHEEQAVYTFKRSAANGIRFHSFVQFLFFSQWEKLKKYANDKGIKIIGDIPIYVSLDSADVWANRKLFIFEEDGINPKMVAGCPPDAFTDLGQLWGNPVYDWDYHRETGYKWWITRIRHCMKLYDMTRIDHFRGFDTFYTIPFGMPDAKIGQWRPGPGYAFFEALTNALGDLPLIAEDLGYLTDSVRNLVKKSGFPSMKVLQFAFEPDEDSEYLPHNCTPNTVIYSGTHDNETVNGWWAGLDSPHRAYIADYLNFKPKSKDVSEYIIRAAMSATSCVCIIPLSDWLGLGNEARYNTPGTTFKNWNWRIRKGQLTQTLEEKMKRLTLLYKR